MQANQQPTCPYTGATNVEYLFDAIDHTVSRETFAVYRNPDLDFYFTWPRPSEDSIGKYYEAEAYISHSDTNKGLFNALYHWVRSFTLKSKIKLIQKYTAQKRLLDIGSGTGAFLNQAARSGFNVTGIEPSEAARNVAYTKYNLTLKPLDALFHLPPNSFDIVTMWHVLEHAYQLKATLNTLHNVLSEKGWAIIAVPNAASAEAEWNGTVWAGWDVPRHLYHFTPTAIQQLFNYHGFKCVHYQHMPFDPFYVSMLTEKIKTGKVNIWKGFWKGLSAFNAGRSNTDKATCIVYIFQKND